MIAPAATLAVGAATAVAALQATPGAKSASASTNTPLVSETETRAVDIPVNLALQGHIASLDFVDVRHQLTSTLLSMCCALAIGATIAIGRVFNVCI